MRCAGLCLVLLVSAGCAGNVEKSAPHPLPPSSYGPAVAFTLPDVAGGSYSMSAKPGRYIVLSFVSATCRDACPQIEAILKQAAQLLQQRGELGHNVEFVTVEIDPAHDSLNTVRALRARLWPHPGWAFLRGTPRQSQPILQTYDEMPVPNSSGPDIAHPTFVYVIDPVGHTNILGLNAAISSAKLTAKNVARLVRRRGSGHSS